MAFFLPYLKSKFLPCLMISCFAPTSFSAEARAGSSVIQIGSYNAENLWDDDPDNTTKAWKNFQDRLEGEQKDPPTEKRSIQYDDYSLAHSNWYEPFVLRAKVQQVVQGIRLAGSPDILALQEIESAGNNSRVWEIPCGQGCTLRSELEKLGYRYFLLGMQDENEPVSVTTAFISKLPIKNLEPVDIHFDAPSSSARDAQVVETLIGETRLLIINAHLKSKAGGRSSEDQRISSAELIKRRIEEEKSKDHQTRVIVLGDLNSSYDEEPLLALDASGDKKLFLTGSSHQFYNLWFENPVQKRWESSWNGTNNTLSHILIDEGFFYDQGLIYKDLSFRVIGHEDEASHDLLTVDGTPFRWQIKQDFKKAIHLGKGFSDHLPLVATFEYVPFKKDASPKKRKNMQVIKHKEDLPVSDRLTAPKLCKQSEIVDFNLIKIHSADDLVGRCIKIELKEAVPFKLTGIFKNTYVPLAISKNVINLTITMNRSFDWRPNKDDSRISRDDIDSIDMSVFGSEKPHPHSNRCFVRNVLQGKGGKLSKAIGRVGYTNGQLSLFLPSREEAYLKLVDLPENKASACPW